LIKGHVISEKDLSYKRPGTGISPENEELLIGRTLKRNVGYDDLVSFEDFSL